MSTKNDFYLNARTPFGVIVAVEDRLYNAEVIVRHKDGTSSTHLLHRLIALGLTFATSPRKEAHV